MEGDFLTAGPLFSDTDKLQFLWDKAVLIGKKNMKTLHKDADMAKAGSAVTAKSSFFQMKPHKLISDLTVFTTCYRYCYMLLMTNSSTAI